MSHSQRLPLRDIEAAFRLAREACELGDDAIGWRSHLLGRLDSLIDCASSMMFVGTLPFDAAKIGMRLFVGRRLDPHWVRYADCRDVRPDPCTAWIVPRLAEGFCEVRQRMCDERAWYDSPYFNEVLRPIRQDHYLVSVRPVPGQGLFSAVGLVGRLGGPAFGGREQRLVELLHRELSHLWQTPMLSTRLGQNELSPRLSQVLEGLTEGLSEKQIALRLNLSRPTVHNHVSRLHESLGVSSRGELLAKISPRADFRPRLLGAQQPPLSAQLAAACTGE